MIGARHTHARAKISCNGIHPGVIRSNNHAGEIRGQRSTFPDVLQHGFGGDLRQHLAGETSGCKSGRNDAENFTRHRGSYHKTPMLFLGKRGWPAAMAPSHAKLLICCAVGICLGSAIWGQAKLEVRTKPGEKTEPRPQSNLRVDSTLVDR